MNNSENSNGSSFSIRWPALSLGLGIITLTTLGTLVVVVDQKDIDTLATVALGLAVLSFAAQLIVTLAQSFQSSQVNSEMKATLAGMSATTEALLTNQSDQYNTLLKAALKGAIEDVTGDDSVESSAGDLRAEELTGAVFSRLATELGPLQPEPRVVVSTTNKAKEEKRAKLLARVAEYPTQEAGEPVVAVLVDLSPRAIAFFGRIYIDVVRRARKDESAHYTLPEETGTSRALEQVEERNLVRVSRLEENRVIVQLTETGWIGTQLLRGQPEPPIWAQPLEG